MRDTTRDELKRFQDAWHLSGVLKFGGAKRRLKKLSNKGYVGSQKVLEIYMSDTTRELSSRTRELSSSNLVSRLRPRR